MACLDHSRWQGGLERGLSELDSLKLLERCGALLTGHFCLSSGRHSNRYLQCAVALQHPYIAERLGVALADRVTAIGKEPPGAVVSPALGGLIIGHETGRALKVRACFVEQVNGRITLRRGFNLAPNEPVLIVEDVVTTGLSSREAMQAVEASGGRPIGLACIANRGGHACIAKLPVTALVALNFTSWDERDCPLCASGQTIDKPGSRKP